MQRAADERAYLGIAGAETATPIAAQDSTSRILSPVIQIADDPAQILLQRRIAQTEGGVEFSYGRIARVATEEKPCYIAGQQLGQAKDECRREQNCEQHQ